MELLLFSKVLSKLKIFQPTTLGGKGLSLKLVLIERNLWVEEVVQLRDKGLDIVTDRWRSFDQLFSYSHICSRFSSAARICFLS